MTNFIFKSPSDLQKISQQIQVLLAEQRLQRGDLQELLFQMKKVTNQFNLETTVKGYYQDKLDNGPTEYSS